MRRWIPVLLAVAAVAGCAGERCPTTMSPDRLDVVPSDAVPLDAAGVAALPPPFQKVLREAREEGRGVETLSEEEVGAVFGAWERFDPSHTRPILVDGAAFRAFVEMC